MPTQLQNARMENAKLKAIMKQLLRRPPRCWHCEATECFWCGRPSRYGAPSHYDDCLWITFHKAIDSVSEPTENSNPTDSAEKSSAPQDA